MSLLTAGLIRYPAGNPSRSISSGWSEYSNLMTGRLVGGHVHAPWSFMARHSALVEWKHALYAGLKHCPTAQEPVRSQGRT